MSRSIIQVENLAKVYHIRHQQMESYASLRDSLMHLAASVGRRFLSRLRGTAMLGKPTREEFWALQDVSFEVQPSDAVGIIGLNGAGKSTLLKVLSRITAPTRGRIRIGGRVASLLEVGTGFHPELTGRENVFLNGAILGMSRKEISRKFDAIVAFAEVEKFLDTPVKYFSSGMYMRLAFAVAAHLEPEILIVDEVLAVGDAAFQDKCLGKMQSVTQGGRTVLFVSHNMAAVQRLCQSAILLEKGRIRLHGSSQDVVAHYLASLSEREAEKLWKPEEIPGGSLFRPIALRIRNSGGQVVQQVLSREPFVAELDYELTALCQGMRVALYVYGNQGEYLFMSRDLDDPEKYKAFQTRGPGRYRTRCHFPGNLLNEGRFFLGINAGVPGVSRLFQQEHVLAFRVDIVGGVGTHWPPEDSSGFIRPLFAWDIERLEG
jgi:lipopolysaccharide transport system ATP-binding protein